ncbi:MAG: hypothetical protein KBC95_03445 [Candidatus Peribacteraceae bacterium]|nr:hypothetical protein [Candidatus Peribacteraceae bacterium]
MSYQEHSEKWKRAVCMTYEQPCEREEFYDLLEGALQRLALEEEVVRLYQKDLARRIAAGCLSFVRLAQLALGEIVMTAAEERHVKNCGYCQSWVYKRES